MSRPRLHCLMVALRPSDLVEIRDTAAALAEAGHRSTLLYLYAGTDIGWHRAALDAISDANTSGTPGVTIVPLDMLSIHRGIFERAQPVDALIAEQHRTHVTIETPAAATPGLWPKIWRRLRDPIGTARVLAEVGPGMARLLPRIPASMWADAFTVVRRANDASLVYRRFRSFFARLIREDRIDAVVIPEDIVGPVWPVMIKAAHEQDTPVLVCPYTLANSAEAVQSLKGEPAFQTSANAIANYLYPSWRLQSDGIDLVRMPSEHIFAHEALGITPPDPWMMNSGYADRILVDSQASFDYFRAGGIAADRMTVTGSVSQDRMHRAMQRRDEELSAVRSRLQLRGSKPMLLISGCPNQLSASVPYCEFTTIEALAAFVGESVAPLAEHYHLVVRPHPNFPEFGGLLAPFGVAASLEPTAALVPLADVFVAFASATIRWAIACGIPTINYDVFHYQYADFDSAAGVRTVRGRQEFRDGVRALIPGSPAMGDVAARARADRAHWSVMDGNGARRIEDAIIAAWAERRNVSKEQQRNA